MLFDIFKELNLKRNVFVTRKFFQHLDQIYKLLWQPKLLEKSLSSSILKQVQDYVKDSPLPELKSENQFLQKLVLPSLSELMNSPQWANQDQYQNILQCMFQFLGSFQSGFDDVTWGIIFD